MMRRKYRLMVLAAWLWISNAAICVADEPQISNSETQKLIPLVRVVDLSIDESQSVQLHDGSQVTVRLVSLSEQRDSLSEAVRRA